MLLVSLFFLYANETQNSLERAQSFYSAFTPISSVVIEATKSKEQFAHVKNCEDMDAPTIYIQPNLQSIQLQLAMVHEISHIYRCNYQPQEERWLNEGLAKNFEGAYGRSWSYLFQQKLANLEYIELSNDKKQYCRSCPGYTSSYFFLLYLSEHFGKQTFLENLLESPLRGWENIESQLKNAPITNRQALWRHFAMALFYNSKTIAQYDLFFLHPLYHRASSQQPKWLRQQALPRNPKDPFFYFTTSLENFSEEKGVKIYGLNAQGSVIDLLETKTQAYPYYLVIREP